MMAYRGYPVRQLCGRCSFEEVAYLLWHGARPTRDQLLAQNRAERARRALPLAVASAIADQPETARPLDTLQTAVTLLGASGPFRRDVSADAMQANGLSLFAALPSVIAMNQRRRQGFGAIAPRDDLGYASNFLYMTFGKVAEPQVVAAFEASLILYAGDSVDAGDFPGHPGARAPSRLPSVVAAAIGALSGPQDAGAAEAVVAMLDEIAIPDNAEAWLKDALADGRPIAGFGRRIGAIEDPRVALMRARLGMIAALRDGLARVAVYDALRTAVYDALRWRPGLGYPASLACHLIGFDTPDFLPVVAAARLPGWTAWLTGQFADSLVQPPAASDDPAESHPAATP
jgi:citrate synthase